MTERALSDLLAWSKKLEKYSLEQLAVNPIPPCGIEIIDLVADQIHVQWIVVKKAEKKLKAFTELSNNLHKISSHDERAAFCLNLISNELRVSEFCQLIARSDWYHPEETMFIDYLNDPIPKDWLDSLLVGEATAVVMNSVDCFSSRLCIHSDYKDEQSGSHYMFAMIGNLNHVFMFHRSLGSPPFTEFDRELVTGLLRNVDLIIENSKLYHDVLRAKSELHRVNSELVDLNVSLEHKVRERTSDLSEAKDRAEQAQVEAEKANRSKSDFLALMSHEIRTPMNGVLGMAQLLETTNLSDEQNTYVRTIKSTGQLLLTLINDILDYSKIESGQLTIEHLPFSLSEVVQDVLHMFTNMAEQKGLDFSVSIDSSIPSTLIGDKIRLRQILINLCNNAIKFTEHGGIKLNVNLRLSAGSAKEVVFSVTDTGIGISSEQMPKLFKPFSQAEESTSRKYGGTGLGLAIAKRLVNAMGGEIGVRSNHGEGSVFWFKIPATASASEGNVKRLQVEPSSLYISAEINKEARILVVEDNPVNQLTIEAMLKKEGLSCEIVSSGEMALTTYQKQAWDLIFMDCLLPDITGYEVTEQIRLMEQGKQPPIVALTANAMQEDVKRCYDSGMNGFISKPIRREELHQTLINFLAT